MAGWLKAVAKVTVKSTVVALVGVGEAGVIETTKVGCGKALAEPLTGRSTSVVFRAVSAMLPEYGPTAAVAASLMYSMAWNEPGAASSLPSH